MTVAKRVLAFLFVVGLIFSVRPTASALVTERKSEESEKYLWDALSVYSPSDVITSGVMGYFWRESQYKSDSVTGWATLLAYEGFDLCSYFAARVDDGIADGSSRAWFVEAARNCGGYGLGQWYSMSYLETLYDFAREYGSSITDAEMQCAFIIESLRANDSLWSELISCDDPEEAGRLVSVYYDGSQEAAPYIGYVSAEIHRKYSVIQVR